MRISPLTLLVFAATGRTRKPVKLGSLISLNKFAPTCPFKSKPWPSWVFTSSLILNAKRPKALTLGFNASSR